MTLGEQIKKSRTSVKLTQQTVANRAGLSLATVQLLESGREPSLDTLLRVLQVLKSPVEFEVKGAKMVLAEVGQMEKLVSMIARGKR